MSLQDCFMKKLKEPQQLSETSAIKNSAPNLVPDSSSVSSKVLFFSNEISNLLSAYDYELVNGVYGVSVSRRVGAIVLV